MYVCIGRRLKTVVLRVEGRVCVFEGERGVEREAWRERTGERGETDKQQQWKTR